MKSEQAWWRAAAMALSLLLALSSRAVAQGGGGLDVHHPPGLEGLADRIRGVYPELLGEAETKLGVDYRQRLEVRVTRDHDAFNAAVTSLGAAPRPKHVAAVAFSYRDVIVLKTASWRAATGREFETIFQHEIVHCVLGQLQRDKNFVLPRWLDEGLAQWVTDEPYILDPGVLDRAARRDALLSFEELTKVFPEHEGASALAYAQSLSLVRFISRQKALDEHRRGNIRGLLRFLANGSSIEESLYFVTGLEPHELERAWKGDLRERVSVNLRDLPNILVSGAMVIAVFLAILSYMSRRRRRLDAFDAEEEMPEDELTSS